MSMNTLLVDGQEYEVGHEAKCLRKLWACVFLKGLQDATNELKARAREADPPPLSAYAALQWVEDDSLHPGGFLWLCDLFDIDPGQGRQRWKDQQSGFPPPANSTEELSA